MVPDHKISQSQQGDRRHARSAHNHSRIHCWNLQPPDLLVDQPSHQGTFTLSHTNQEFMQVAIALPWGYLQHHLLIVACIVSLAFSLGIDLQFRIC
jgi:hypothetical protein